MLKGIFNKKNLTIFFLFTLTFLILTSCTKHIVKFNLNEITNTESPSYLGLIGGYFNPGISTNDKEYWLFDSTGTFSLILTGGCWNVPSMFIGKWGIKGSLIILDIQKNVIGNCVTSPTHQDSVIEYSPVKQNVYEIIKLNDKYLIIRPWKCLFCKKIKFDKVKESNESIFRRYKCIYWRN